MEFGAVFGRNIESIVVFGRNIAVAYKEAKEAGWRDDAPFGV